MIGFLITGHGDFSVGLESSLNMIAGEQDAFAIVPFYESADLDSFQSELKTAIDKLLESSDGVVIFTDLLGGSPFKTSMIVASEYENVETITGTNLPMLLEGTALRFTEDVKEFTKQLIENGKMGIQNPQIELETENEKENSFEGGI